VCETQQELVAAKRIKTSCYADGQAGAIRAQRLSSQGGGWMRARQARTAAFSRPETTSKLDEAPLTDDLDVRRRRAAYRAAHRGTKEMDALVGRYADAKIAIFDGAALERFERFLAIADPTLQNWIFAKESVSDGEFEALVDDIRTFHGLESLAGRTE
jgi:antitoxin CptB